MKQDKTYKEPFKQADIPWNRSEIESEKEYPVRVIVDADSSYIGQLYLFKNRDLADAFCYGIKTRSDYKDWNYEIIDFTLQSLGVVHNHVVKNGKLLNKTG